MATVNRLSRSITRRTLLTGALLAPAAAAMPSCAAGLITSRPRLTHGVATGDPRSDGVLVWARSDSPARMVVETSATESFSHPLRFDGPTLTPETDGTGRLRLTGLEPGQTVHYRVTLEGEHGATSEPMLGVFVTAPDRPNDITFLWSGDVAGQGWGINRRGGMAIFAAMADRRPDFFIHSGDAIYADGPIPETKRQNDGTIYRNITAPAKDHVAQTVDDFRGNYAYNLTDEHYRRFNASVPQLVQWDDHEVINNWFPGQSMARNRRKGYTETEVDTLARHGYQAWREWQPVDPSEAADGRLYRRIAYGPLLDVFLLDMRSYKNPNSQAWAPADDHGVLGREQTEWLIEGLKNSTAVWKVVANDLPISIVVPDTATDPAYGPASMEALAQGEDGRPLGREIAFARVLSDTKEVGNVVFLTADVHYTAAISYHPERAGFTDFSPFWEFVSGPLNATAAPPSPLDRTFGARYEFVHAPADPNTSPAQGFQHFGEVTIDAESRALTVRLCDRSGRTLYTREIAPQ
ncbi:alkaline phosphatase [Mycolicibacterium duvalii]|uniref:Alkaline phosphatase n=2 Tax=Mycolicibacterium duvalii TaxID=39688 RepID=A0A7I7JWU1_9MYCO|nr:alkaline phosphatase [Mycolicibacterium duvalii]